MKKIVFVSDFFSNQILGGGELNDAELINILSKNNEVYSINSHLLSIDDIRRFYNNNYRFIISNFANLSNDCKTELLTKEYVIYEHDHKYLQSRNPGLYNDFLAPIKDIINVDFFRMARRVFTQTAMHKRIIYTNLKIENLVNLSGNLWSLETLNMLEELSGNIKKDRYMILNSSIPHKNTDLTMLYCEKKNIPYDLVSDPDYKSFLNKMSDYKGFIFIPKTPETLSRVCVEARLLGMETITSNNIGAVHEPWFSYPPKEIKEYLIDFRRKIELIIMESL